VAFGVAELGARWLLPAPPVATVRTEDARLDADAFVAADKQGLYVETEAGFRLRPSTTVEIESHPLNQRDVTIRTNSLGYRGPEIGPKQRTRVLFLGDSITFADWLPEEETFVRRIEALSEREGPPLETINAGAGGVGIAYELAILLETGLATRPDVVVVDFFLNDTGASQGVRPIAPPDWLAWSALLRHALHVVAVSLPRDEPEQASDGERRPREGQAWLREIERDFPGGDGDPLHGEAAFNRVIQKRVSDWGSAWSRQAWVRIEAAFRELRRLSDEHGFRLLVVAFPVRMQVAADFVRDEPQQWLRDLTDELGIPMLDLLPKFRELHRESDELIFLDHCHHTSPGQEKIAEWIHAFLRQQLAERSP